MKILIADNNIKDQKKISDFVSGYYTDVQIQILSDEISDDYNADILFINPDLFSENWTDTAEKIKKNNTRLNVIICSSSQEYMPAAFRMHASGYILKPVSDEKIKSELENLLYPFEIKIQTFGNFGIFVNEKPVSFRRSKSREVLAYLVDRRTSCTRKQIAACIFEDRMYDRSCQKYLDNILRDMKEDLSLAGADNLVIHENNLYSVNQEICRCDYFDMISGKSKKEFYGEYMTQYSWAEVTLAFLNNI